MVVRIISSLCYLLRDFFGSDDILAFKLWSLTSNFPSHQLRMSVIFTESLNCLACQAFRELSRISEPQFK